MRGAGSVRGWERVGYREVTHGVDGGGEERLVDGVGEPGEPEGDGAWEGGVGGGGGLEGGHGDGGEGRVGEGVGC